MRKVYDRIIDMRGNLITVAAEGVCLGEVARIHKGNGTIDLRLRSPFRRRSRHLASF